MQVKGKSKSRYLDVLMGLLGLLAIVAMVVMKLYGTTKYKGFITRECTRIESTFDLSWGNQKIQTTLPGTIENPDKDNILIQMTLHKKELGEGDSILFRSRQSGVKVYLDGELLYGSEAAFDYPFLLGYGSFWRSVTLGENYDGKRLTIELEPAYRMSAVSGYLPDLFFGTQASFMAMILENVFWYLVLTTILIVIGVCLLVYGLALIRKKEIHSMIVLGLFSTDIGLWMLTETHVLELFVSDIALVIYLGYLTYGLMPVLLIRFLLGYSEFRTKKYLQLLYLVGIVLNLVQLLMAMTRICSPFESQAINRVYLVLTAVGLLAALPSARKVEKERRRLYSGIFILVISTICELIYFFLVSKKNSGRILILGICLFIIKSGIDLIKEIKQIQKTDMEQEILIKMAYTDSMTKLGNRNAYDQERSRLEEKANTHVTVMVADVDGLKHVNDSHGRMYGDQIICKTAQILSESFEGIGKCFRIGGDEFCILAENIERAEFEVGIQKMKEEVSKLQNNICGYGIAYGVAEGTALEIGDSFHIANNLMYSRKKDIRVENEMFKR